MARGRATALGRLPRNLTWRQLGVRYDIHRRHFTRNSYNKALKIIIVSYDLTLPGLVVKPKEGKPWLNP
jgi:hypothetical protein